MGSVSSVQVLCKAYVYALVFFQPSSVNSLFFSGSSLVFLCRLPPHPADPFFLFPTDSLWILVQLKRKLGVWCCLCKRKSILIRCGSLRR